MKVAGLFAGIGGIELGFQRAGHHAELLCEIDADAQSVLRKRFPTASWTDDVRDVRRLPRTVQVLAAGFPCTDISQAGRTAGIFGDQSGLVREVFRIVGRRAPEWIVIENVQNMLVLSKGIAMRFIIDELEAMGMRWAYRVVDSRAFGVPQRRRRVILVASRVHDPKQVLFADDAGARPDAHYKSDAFGFYWTEGLRGLGWAQDAVPTLKGGSTIGIPSPPGIWIPDAEPGRRLVMPDVGDAEQLQGFPRGWTSAVEGTRTRGKRLKLVGNAVTVGVAQWIGQRLEHPGEPLSTGAAMLTDQKWPTAAWGEAGNRWHVPEISEYPVHRRYRHLTSVVRTDVAPAVSHRGAKGFLERTTRAKLRFDAQFIEDVADHVRVTAV